MKGGGSRGARASSSEGPVGLAAPAAGVAVLAVVLLVITETPTLGEGARHAAGPLPPACVAPRPEAATDGPSLGLAVAETPAELMAALFSGGSAFYPAHTAAPGPRSGPDPELELELSGPAVRRAGEALALRLAFRNASGRPMVVMRPLDGSLEGWREPTYDLYLRDRTAGSTFRWAFVGSRCGNVNPITPDDLVVLSPGDRRSDIVNGWAAHLATAAIPRPGEYEVWVVYRFCGEGGHGVPLGPDVSTSAVHLGVHATEALRLTVR